MDGHGNIEIHTPEPVPIEHIFRAVCGLRKIANEKVLEVKPIEEECDA
jgi:hypothetical protein